MFSKIGSRTLRGIAVQYKKLNEDGELLQDEQVALRERLPNYLISSLAKTN